MDSKSPQNNPNGQGSNQQHNLIYKISPDEVSQSFLNSMGTTPGWQEQEQGSLEAADYAKRFHPNDDGDKANHATSPNETLTLTSSSNEGSSINSEPDTDKDVIATSSQPLQTLKKLQQMLDETDYMTTTATSTRGGDDVPRSLSPSNHQKFPYVATSAAMTPIDENNSRGSRTTEDRFQHQSHASPPDLPPHHLYQHQDPNKDSHLSSQQRESQHLDTELIPDSHSQYQVPISQQQTQQPNFPDEANQQHNRDRQSSNPQSQQTQDLVHPLWTSKDRSKYKKMQQIQRRIEDERRRLEQHLLQQQNGASSDDEEQDGLTDTDDGLGYTLPNLPVYMSDAEGESSDPGDHLLDTNIVQIPQQIQQQQRQVPFVPPMPSINSHYGQSPPDLFLQQQSAYLKSQGQPFPPQNVQQQIQQGTPFMGNYGIGYPPYMPYYNPQQLHQQQTQQSYANQQQQLYPNPQQQTLSAHYSAAWGYPQNRLLVPPGHAQTTSGVSNELTSIPFEQQLVVSEVPTTLAEATSRINFDSIQKLSLLFVGVATLSYCAVSPRNLQPLSEYNRHFYDNVRLVALCTIVPMANFLLVCDARENDINSVITSFYTSFTVGYALAFILEIIMTTVLRLGVFAVWEPNIFKLCPKVPLLVLPWVLRENRYRPKRITLFAADFLSSCVASPIIEEYVKLKILQLTVRLPRNFVWSTKTSTNSSGKNDLKKNRKSKRLVAEAAPKTPGENTDEVTNINSYVTQMLAVSLGMKLCDSSRRILMYTKVNNLNKSFYAFLRGAFPIQELCGTMTALELAKRNVLGVTMAQWQMLLPAVLIHGMANLRGMKPLFKWNSATPWSEMQLSPWNTADHSTLPQLINKGFAKFMWLVLLGRVLGYCIKNYYLISRQARKRTTTYAGKQAAFSAELAAAEMLKKSKDKK